MANVVLVRGKYEDRYEEGRVRSGFSIKPGMWIKQHTDGTWYPHDVAEALGGAECAVALEHPNPAWKASSKITDAIAAGDIVGFIRPKQGDKLQMILKAGQNVANGGKLSSNGDGTLKVPAGATSFSPFVADGALDLSAGGSVDSFVIARRI